jgi:hypothetical protein
MTTRRVHSGCTAGNWAKEAVGQGRGVALLDQATSQIYAGVFYACGQYIHAGECGKALQKMLCGTTTNLSV